MDKQYLDFLKKDAPKKIREEEVLNEGANLSDMDEKVISRLDQEIELEIERAVSNRELFVEILEAGDPMSAARDACRGLAFGTPKYKECMAAQMKKLKRKAAAGKKVKTEAIKPGMSMDDLRKTKEEGDKEAKEARDRQVGKVTEDMGMIGALAGATVAAPIITWAHKKYRDVYGKANEACAKLGGKEGKMCRNQYKMKAAKAEISSLKYARSKCGNAQDRKACLTKINAKIKELQSKYPETQFKD